MPPGADTWRKDEPSSELRGQAETRQPAAEGTAAKSRAGDEIYVGRQALYDRSLQIIGYELLFRSGGRNAAAFESGPQATSQVLLHALLDIGLERIAGANPIFVNIPHDLISDSITEILPPGRTVLEILEDVVFTDEVTARLASLRKAGYKLALDDFVYTEERDRGLALADIVKVDVRMFEPEALAEQVRLLRRYPLELVAEKVETQDEFLYCKELGFDYFQGYFLSLPEIVHGTRSTVDANTLTLLVESCRDPLPGNPSVADQIRQNATLSYRLLQAAKSCFDEGQAPIGSVHEAVDFLGTVFVSRLANLFLMAGATNQPSYRLLGALERACMCEILAEPAGVESPSQAHLAGLLSALDMLLGQPIEAVVSPLPLADELKDALVKHEGPLGKLLKTVIAYEQRNWEAITERGLDLATVRDAYWRAVPRVEEFRRQLDSSAARGAAQG